MLVCTGARGEMPVRPRAWDGWWCAGWCGVSCSVRADQSRSCRSCQVRRVCSVHLSVSRASLRFLHYPPPPPFTHSYTSCTRRVPIRPHGIAHRSAPPGARRLPWSPRVVPVSFPLSAYCGKCGVPPLVRSPHDPLYGGRPHLDRVAFRPLAVPFFHVRTTRCAAGASRGLVVRRRPLLCPPLSFPPLSRRGRRPFRCAPHPPTHRGLARQRRKMGPLELLDVGFVGL